MKITYKLFLFIVFLVGSFTHSYAQEETGWLKLYTNKDDFYLIINNNFDQIYRIDSGDSVLVEAGFHRLLLVGANFNDYKTTLHVLPDTTSSKRLNFNLRERPRSSWNIIENRRNAAISSDNGSDIYVDNKLVGTTYAEVLLGTGMHRLRIEHPEYGKLSSSFIINPLETTEVARYNADPSPPPFLIKLLPGGSYLANQQYSKAIVTYVGMAALTSLALNYNNEYNDLNDQYTQYHITYLNASSPEEAVRARELSLSTLDKMDKANAKLTLSFVGAAAVYLATTLDGLRKPRNGYSGPSQFLPEISLLSNPVTGQNYPMFSLSRKLQ